MLYTHFGSHILSRTSFHTVSGVPQSIGPAQSGLHTGRKKKEWQLVWGNQGKENTPESRHCGLIHFSSRKYYRSVIRSVMVCVFVPGFVKLDQMSGKQKESQHVCYLSRKRTREYLYLISFTFIHLSLLIVILKRVFKSKMYSLLCVWALSHAHLY